MTVCTTTVEERAAAVHAATEKLRMLPTVQGASIAMGVAVELAKDAGMDADRFAAWAYVAFEHCGGTEEEAIEAMRQALAAVRAARSKR